MIEDIKEKMIAEVEVELGESDDIEVEGSGVTEFVNEQLDPEKVREAPKTASVRLTKDLSKQG